MNNIKGTFSILIDGKEVRRSQNIITDSGRISILRYLARDTQYYANCLAVGVDSTPPSVTDTELGYEVYRERVGMTSVDIESSEILFRSSFPAGLRYVISEIGLFSDGVLAKSSLTNAFSSDESWQGTFYPNLSDILVGTEGITVVAESANESIYNENQLSFLNMLRGDKFRLAAILYDDNCESISITFTDFYGNDSVGVFTIPSYSGGGSAQTFITEISKSDFSDLTIDWANIVRTDIEIEPTAATTSTVVLDALKTSYANVVEGSQVVAKTILADTLIKEEDSTMEIQYTLSVPI